MPSAAENCRLGSRWPKKLHWHKDKQLTRSGLFERKVPEFQDVERKEDSKRRKWHVLFYGFSTVFPTIKQITKHVNHVIWGQTMMINDEHPWISLNLSHFEDILRLPRKIPTFLTHSRHSHDAFETAKFGQGHYGLGREHDEHGGWHGKSAAWRRNQLKYSKYTCI